MDTRNHGASGHSPVMNYEVMASDIMAFLDSNNIAKASLIGHSMGGKIVMTAALQTSQRVENLIVVDSAPTTSVSTGEIWSYLKAMKNMDMAEIKTRNEVDSILGQVAKVTCCPLSTVYRMQGPNQNLQACIL